MRMKDLDNFNRTPFVEIEVFNGRQIRRAVFIPSEAIISNEVRQMLEYVVDFALISVICYIGIIGNSITIAAFYRQGFKETINISLTTITIWDLAKCICGAIYRVCGPIQAVSPLHELTYDAVSGLIFAFPSIFCTYVSTVLAGYVAIERCLCVSLPFTVKYLLTPRVVTSVMVLLSILSFGSCAVVFIVYRIVWAFHPSFNTTVAMRTYKSVSIDYKTVLRYYNVIGFLWPALSLGVQCVCTWIISYHLRKGSLFRSTALGSSSKEEKVNNKGISARDRQVTKMLLVIIIVYMLNMLPRLSISVAKTIESEFYMQRRYHNLFACCMWFEYLFDFLNAAVNPFIYYFMSSQYKASLLGLLRSSRKK